MGGDTVVLFGDIPFTDEFHDFAERINVGTGIVVLPLDDFRGDKFHLFDKELTVSILIGFGHADIYQLDTIIIGCNHDVFRHQVTMDHPIAVQILQCVTNLNENTLHLFFGECAHSHMFGQSLTLNKLKYNAIAKALDIDEIKCLAEELVVEHVGNIILLAQRSLA